MMHGNLCRNCGANLDVVVCDLGTAPPSNAYLSKQELSNPEIYYPLRLYFCEECMLVQIENYTQASEIFGKDYRYYSSFSKLWLNHAENYVKMIIPKLNLTEKSKVMEIASNDGYLLQYFKKEGIPCFGVDPALLPAKDASDKGVETIVAMFDFSMAKTIVKTRGKQDLIIGNNVLAHVPNINNFVAGLKACLSETGTITLEFPHFLELIRNTQFDTIYHEHYSYLMLTAVNSIFKKHGLRIYDVEKFFTHGGSLRIYACHDNCPSEPDALPLARIISEEYANGLFEPETYTGFQEKVRNIRDWFLKFLITQRRNNKRVVAYGAAAKGNTLLNYCGIKGTDLIEYVADASPYKQGFCLPGSRIPIVEPSQIFKDKPDFIIILPWNIKDEIMEQLKDVREWGCQFVIPIPGVEIV